MFEKECESWGCKQKSPAWTKLLFHGTETARSRPVQFWTSLGRILDGPELIYVCVYIYIYIHLWISLLEKFPKVALGLLLFSQAETELEIVLEQILKSTTKTALCLNKNKEVVPLKNLTPFKSYFQDKKYFEKNFETKNSYFGMNRFQKFTTNCQKYFSTKISFGTKRFQKA